MLIDLLAAELRRAWILAIRYPIESLLGIVLTTIIFLGLFAGATYVAGSATRFGESVGSLILGYFAWLVLISGLGHVAGEMENDGKTGVLEAVFSTSYSLEVLFLARAVAGLCATLVTSAAVCVFVALLTGHSINVRTIIALPIATLALTAIGLGMAAGGAALLAKKINFLLAPLYLAFLPLMLVRFEDWQAPARQFAWVLPAVPSAALLRQSAAEAFSPRISDMAIAFGSACAYLVIGIAVFAFCTRVARRRGVIGMQ